MYKISYLPTLIFFILLFCNFFATAQTRVIYFKDKANTSFSVQRPQEFVSQKSIERRAKQGISFTIKDLPVNTTYLTALRQAGVQVRYSSKWFNACVAVCDENTWNTVKQLPFIKSGQQISEATKIENPILDKQESKQLFPDPNTTNSGRGEGEENYGTSLTQVKMIGIDEMHKANFTGKGMTIAVFDGGFTNVDVNKQGTYSKMTILGTYSFVHMNPYVYAYSSHGANVLSVLAAYRPAEVIGAAFEASYYLFITENDDRLLDDRIEEFNWLAAAERADSLGVDIINSSLGYNYFKNSIYNYKQSDLNGKTSVISQAATLAASSGMLVVSSAGNIFEPEWTKIKMPADADSILAVGSVDAQANWVASSLLGNTTDGRVKPDVSTMGNNVAGISTSGFLSLFNGTSYASPLAAGLAAGLWQANPKMTAMQLLNAIRRSANQYFAPNEKLGYGIPNYTKAMNVLGTTKEELTEQNFMVFPNPMNSKDGILTLSFDEKLLQEVCNLTILDNSGKQVFSNELTISQKNMIYSLQNSHFSQGVYILRIEGKKFKATRKLIVY